jgi:pimeloyl-ACP methyl ester carboxylesterase
VTCDARAMDARWRRDGFDDRGALAFQRRSRVLRSQGRYSCQLPDDCLSCSFSPVAVVFVHGVPETAAVWDGVRAAIERESLALSLPGFDSPRPDGFAATKEDYASWLREQLDQIDELIDIVGHDVGAWFVLRLATDQPDRIRSWVADPVMSFHPDYVWHKYAQQWQAPGTGDAFMEAFNALPVEEQAAILIADGVPERFAEEMCRRVDVTMEQCILDLYRSATELHRDWGTNLQPTVAPGLVLLASKDVFANTSQQKDVAGAVGARTEALDGLGHWWMLEDPRRGASTLERFWATI